MACSADPNIIAVDASPFQLTGVMSSYGDDFQGSSGCFQPWYGASSDLMLRVDLAAGERVIVQDVAPNFQAVINRLAGVCNATASCAGYTYPALHDYTASSAETVYFSVESMYPGSEYAPFDLRVERGLCGDGVINSWELCDDGGTAAGDGCSSSCMTEPNYVCEGSPSACFSVTGCTTAACSLGSCAGGTIVQASATLSPYLQIAGGTTASVPLAISQTGTVRAIAAHYYLNSQLPRQMSVRLAEPQGATVDLNLENGSDYWLDLVFRDGAARWINDYPPYPTSGLYRPESPLAVFSGKATNGTWYLRFTNNAPATNAGRAYLYAADIAICVDP
ncbi:MAG: myxococcus cysteine-rich repeat containing protein [Polyangiaceae bacterium]